MVNIFICRCPNLMGVGAIDYPDRFEQVLDIQICRGIGEIDYPYRFEQVLDAYYIPETSEKFSRQTFRWSVLRKCTFSKPKEILSNIEFYIV
eukprot:UN09810